MNPRLRYFSALLVLALALQTATRAQTPAPANDLPPVRLEVTSLTEIRPTAGAPSVNLALQVTEESAPPNASIKQIQLSKVIDNLGRNIGPASLQVSVWPLSPSRPPRILPGFTSLLISSGFTSAVLFSSLIRGTTSILTPVTSGFAVPVGTAFPAPTFPPLQRDATSLRLIEGTIEFYQPTEANGGIIRIPNILSHPGRVEHPGLTGLGIGFRVITDEASAQEVWPLVTTVADNVWPDGIHVMGFYAEDSSGLVVGAEFQDRDSKSIVIDPIPFSSVFLSPRRALVAVPLREPLAADTQLVIYLAVPAAIKSAPFQLENVPLY